MVIYLLFTADDVQELLVQHTEETGQMFAENAQSKIWIAAPQRKATSLSLIAPLARLGDKIFRREEGIGITVWGM